MGWTRANFMSTARLLRWLRNLAVIAALLWLTPGCVNRMFYYPDRVAYRTRDSFQPPAEDVFFPSEDGTLLHGWFVRSTAPVIHGTVVHFHGNAQNLTAHSSFVDWLPAEGFHLFMFDYRGYGKSEGRPSREGLYRDGVAALRHVRTLPGVDTNRIAIVGQSLGGTTALAVAGRHPELAGRALVIDSAFYSYRRIVRDKIELIPLLSLARVPLSYLVISDAYSPVPVIGDIAPIPLLFLHGTADRVIPVEHSRMLHEIASDPKDLIIIEGGRHTSGMMDQRGEIVPRMVSFLIEAMRADE
jgi:fermentation-respiration switch protein FrsA (DUF1100 family)